jgi:hypothetical protein
MNNDIIGSIFNHLRENNPLPPSLNNAPINDVAGVYIGGGGASALDWEDTSNQNTTNSSAVRTLEALLEERRTNVSAAASTKDMDGQRSNLVGLMRELMAANADFMKTEGTLIEESVALSAAFGTGIRYDEDLIAARATINDILDGVSADMDTFDKYKAMCRAIFDYYQTLGRSLRSSEDALKQRISNFDDLQNRLKVLTSMERREGAEYDMLVSATEAYLRFNYDLYKVDEDFRQYIGFYKQWSMLRSIVMTFRVADGSTAANVPTCGICMEDPVSHALQTCGHTYCSNCVRQLGRQCAICRTAIGGKIKIFFT